MHNSAAYSVLTKARSKYGKIVKTVDYDSLCKLTDIREIVAYLKQKTGYSDALSQVNSSAIYRGNLEKLLHLEIRRQVSELCDFQRMLGIQSFEFIDRIAECRLIINRARFMLAGLNSRFVQLPDDGRNSKLYNALLKAETLGDIGTILKDTPFSADAPLFTNDVVRFDFPLVEAHLYRTAFALGFKHFEEYYRGEEKKSVCELLNFYTEIKDLQMLHRCLLLPPSKNLPPKRLLIGKRCYISEKKLQQLLSSANESEFFDVLKTTHYGKTLKNEGDADFDILLFRELKKRCESLFRFSKYPSVVLLAFILILECEYSDLATVIETVRYGYDKNEIPKILITQQIKGVC